MNRAISTYLDAIRFAAALVVFLSHIGQERISDGFLWQFVPYGALAVDFFFVLSGFVIAYAAYEKERDWRDYMAARCVRLYSVVVPALILTALLDAMGRASSAATYAPSDVPPLAAAGRYVFSLAFLNETRWGSFVPGSNTPYWSLGYEAIYYALFGFAFYARGWNRLAVCGAIALVVRPHVMLLLPLWLIGFGAYRICRENRLGPKSGAFLFGISLALEIYGVSWARSYGFLSNDHVMLNPHSDMVVQEFAVAAIFAANIVGFWAWSPRLSVWTEHVAPAVRWLAGATFTLYIVHMPVLNFIRAIGIWPPEAVAYRLTLIAGTLGFVFVVAEIGERRKALWRAAFVARRGIRAVPAGSPTEATAR